MVQDAQGGLARIAIIQGGMGVGVSNWKLARAVSMRGQLGVVSGTGLNTILIRRLQDGDRDGSIRRALERCPLRNASAKILGRYWIEGGRPEGHPYRLSPVFSLTPAPDLVALTIVANFVEIFLAKEGHSGLVGINLLEKLQLPTLPSLFGAMLAGVDCVLMGAGIPRAIPGVLDRLARWEKVELRVAVEGASAEDLHQIEFDPREFLPESQPLRRPAFIAIVSSTALATTLARKSSGRVDGLVVEGVSAGGHNAPPRGVPQLNARGEPVYGPRDAPDLESIRALGLPFWLAGSYAHPDRLQEAQLLGASGVQIGTAFAFCEESGLDPNLKHEVLRKSLSETLGLLTDGRASPTGMPFKVVTLEGSVSDAKVYLKRIRNCALGYLRHPYQKSDHSVGFRCPGEPEDEYVRKGGSLLSTEGRKCLCNALFAAIGLGQPLETAGTEPPILTAGEDVVNLRRFIPAGAATYCAADVLNFMQRLGLLLSPSTP